MFQLTVLTTKICTTMNIFQFSAGVEANFESFLSQCTNPRTREYTFVSDFAIAMVCEDKGDKNAIKSTYDGFIKNWKKSAPAMTELAFSINYLCWFCFENQQFPQYQKFSPVFSALYYKCIDVAEKNLTKNEFSAMMRALD